MTTKLSKNPHIVNTSYSANGIRPVSQPTEQISVISPIAINTSYSANGFSSSGLLGNYQKQPSSASDVLKKSQDRLSSVLPSPVGASGAAIPPARSTEQPSWVGQYTPVAPQGSLTPSFGSSQGTPSYQDNILQQTYPDRFGTRRNMKNITGGTPSTGGSGTSGGTNGGTGGSANPSDDGHIDSYEEFLEHQRDTYRDTYEKTNDLIEQQRQAALQSAENARQKSLADARSSYYLNRSEYGAKGEALAGMGLTGSGYSDYLNAQAYAQQRQDIQKANALEAQERQNADLAANQQRLDSELAYQNNLLQSEENLYKYREQQSAERKSAFQNLLSAANSGQYTAEQLAALAQQYGLAESDIVALQSAATKYGDNQNNSNYFTFLSYAKSGQYTAEDIARLAQGSGLSPEDIAALQKMASESYGKTQSDQNNSAYFQLYDLAASGDYTAEQIKDLAARYGIENQTDVDSLMKAATDAQTRKQLDNAGNLAQESGDTAGYLKYLLDSGKIDRKTYDSNISAWQDENYNLLSDAIKDQYGDFGSDDITDAYNNGEITEGQYNKLAKQYQDHIDSFIGDGTMKELFINASSYQLKQYYNEFMADPLLTDEQKKTITNYYNVLNPTGKDWRNTQVVINGKNYKLTDRRIHVSIDEDEIPENGSVRYGGNGTAYIYYDGYWYFAIGGLTGGKA